MREEPTYFTMLVLGLAVVMWLLAEWWRSRRPVPLEDQLWRNIFKR